MKFNSEQIGIEFDKNLKETKKVLKSLSFSRTFDVDKILKGWVFEQTVDKCLQEEFNNELKIVQQFKLSTLKTQNGNKSRGTVDLAIGEDVKKIFVEVKHSGIFSSVYIEKYAKYRKLIEDNGSLYFYLSLKEEYKPYAEKCQEVFGDENVFLLDIVGDWKRFIDSIKKNLSL